MFDRLLYVWLTIPFITSEEVARWRRTVEAPTDVAALEAYRDWLLAHDPRRGRLLRKRMRTTTPWRDLTSNHFAAEKKAWIAALGIDGCEEIDFEPLPKCLHMNAARIESLGRVLDDLPFLHINLDFCDVAPTAAVLAGIFASPVIAKIRHLSFRAYSDQMDPDENSQSVSRTHYGDRVFAALCASPNITQLETLWILNEQVGGSCATALAAIPFTQLRELRISCEPIGDAGAAALASAPCLASLRRLALTACNLGDAGAVALASSPYLEQLEKLEVSSNAGITAVGEAALRTSRHRSEPPSLVGIQTSPRAEPTFVEQPAAPNLAIFVSLDAFRAHCGEPTMPIEECPICRAIPDHCYRQTICSFVSDYDVDYGDEGYTSTIPSQVSELEMLVNGPKVDSYQGEALLRCPTCHRLYYGKSETEHLGARTYNTTSYQRVDVDTIYGTPWCEKWRAR